jgi:hypothetical protein
MLFTATGQRVDGTIALDPYALSSLLTVTGPIAVKPYGTFDAHNFLLKLEYIVNLQSGFINKKPVQPIAQALVAKLLSQPPDNWPKLLRVFEKQFAGRHVQVFFHDSTLAKAASDARADGAVLKSADDYLMIVDANVGATKGNYFLTRSMKVLTEVYPGVARHQVILHYHMPLPVNAVDRDLNPFRGRYQDYVRFYLPETAGIVSLQGGWDGGHLFNAAFERITLADGKKSAGVFFILPRGHDLELRLAYEVPLAPSRRYTLFVQKQAGIPSLATVFETSYPGRVLTQSSDLATDQEIFVTW